MPVSRSFLPKVWLIRCAVDYFSNWIKAYPYIDSRNWNELRGRGIQQSYKECFHSRGQHRCKFIGTRRKRLHKKRVHLPQDWFGTPTWPPFHCFGTQIWPPWRHVKTHMIIIIPHFFPSMHLAIYYILVIILVGPSVTQCAFFTVGLHLFFSHCCRHF